METTNTQTSVMSVKDWAITLILTMIPLVGIIMLFIWAFGAGHNENKSNWAKAALIIAAVVFVIYIILFVVLLGVIGSAMR
jgi:hypothetical protein